MKKIIAFCLSLLFIITLISCNVNNNTDINNNDKLISKIEIDLTDKYTELFLKDFIMESENNSVFMEIKEVCKKYSFGFTYEAIGNTILFTLYFGYNTYDYIIRSHGITEDGVYFRPEVIDAYFPNNNLNAYTKYLQEKNNLIAGISWSFITRDPRSNGKKYVVNTITKNIYDPVSLEDWYLPVGYVSPNGIFIHGDTYNFLPDLVNSNINYNTTNWQCAFISYDERNRLMNEGWMEIYKLDIEYKYSYKCYKELTQAQKKFLIEHHAEKFILNGD